MYRANANGSGSVSSLRRPASLRLLAGTVLFGFSLSSPAHAGFEVKPAVTLQAVATDNLRKQATNKEGDAVLQSIGAVQVSADTLRLKLLGSASLMYDAFAENSDLNRLTGNGLANAQATIIPGFLFLDGSAQVSDEFLDVLDQSATGLPNGSPQNRVTNLQAGTYVTTKISDVADLKLRGSVATVQSEALKNTPSGATLGEAVSYAGSLLITNGERSRNAVWRLSANITKEDRNNSDEFQSADAAASLQLRVTPRVHVVARGGYEDISGTSITSIKDELWAAGLLYEIGDASSFSAEWGHRYGRESWSGDLDLKLSEHFKVNASYAERIESQQGRLSRELGDIFNQTDSVPTPQLPNPVTPGQSLVDDIFYVKDATLRIGYAGLSETFTLTGRYSERDFSLLPNGDRTAGVSATYSEVLLKDLVLGLTGTYDAALDTPVGVSDGARMVGSGLLSYRLGERASATFQYTWSRTSAVDEITENVASAGITHSF